MSEGNVSWPHAPAHQLSQAGTYFVTASTYMKEHRFRSRQRVKKLCHALLAIAEQYGWHLEAWAVFSNHYHFVAHSPRDEADAQGLSNMLSELHVKTASWVNQLDNTNGRKVWHNFRDTCLTHQISYFARLNYTHQNAVKHGLVEAAHLYPWCSASWFERTASRAMVKSIYRFKTDRVKVADDFEPSEEW